MPRRTPGPERELEEVIEEPVLATLTRRKENPHAGRSHPAPRGGGQENIAVLSAGRPDQLPPEGAPEFAFLGRSNVGKSTLLNCVAGKPLARTSGTPGRTRAIYFYTLDGRHCLVDLPGYGYARVPRDLSASWKDLVEAYLQRRRNLVLCFVLVDARRGWMEKDLELKRWLEHFGRRYAVVATKIDKYRNQKERHHGLAGIRQQCPDADVIPFSAVTGQGVREIWQAISTTNSAT